jgi:hypothetical protein
MARFIMRRRGHATIVEPPAPVRLALEVCAVAGGTVLRIEVSALIEHFRIHRHAKHGERRGGVFLPPGPDSNRSGARDANHSGYDQRSHAERLRYLTRANTPRTSTASTKRNNRPQPIIIPADIGPFIIDPFIISIIPSSLI